MSRTGGRGRWSAAPGWLQGYGRESLAADLLAAIIVTIMLIPQSLAYALLAGLPPEMGLYASILPLVAYAFIGSSRTLSVGPVAVVSLMTASAVGKVATTGTADYASAAIALAALSGLILVLLGILRFGFMANFLSHPVISGFITASGILIALSQMRHMLGVGAAGDTLPAMLQSLWHAIPATSIPTLLTGIGVLLFLLWARHGLQAFMLRLGLPETVAAVLGRAGPVCAVMSTIALSIAINLGDAGVALVGQIPAGLPAFSMPPADLAAWRELAVPALLIAIIGFVESVSVGKTLAAKRRQRISPNRELLALGGANLASAVSGGLPVTGGFSRSVVNFDAGAQTQAASIMTALGMTVAVLFMTPVLAYLPKATLAATIIVAVLALLDVATLKKAWRYARSDFIAVVVTIVTTLLLGVELGVLSGITSSVLLHLHKTTRPHVAVVGAVAGTEHFRNVERHQVITYPNLVSLRVDESLYFANAGFLEDYIYKLIAERENLEHVILQCTAVNEIDMSALEMLESVDHRLREQGITLNLSEVKGPVMDALKQVNFIDRLSGRVFLTHHQAVKCLKLDEPEPYII